MHGGRAMPVQAVQLVRPRIAGQEDSETGFSKDSLQVTAEDAGVRVEQGE